MTTTLLKNRAAGFTLIEVCVTIAIIAILAMIAIPNMIGWRAERKLQGSARVFYSDLQRARNTAIQEGDTVSIVISAPGGTYKLFIDSNQNYTVDGDDTVLKTVKPPNGVTMNADFSGAKQTQFNSRGMAIVAGDVEFVNSRGDNVTINVNSIGRMWIDMD